MRPPSDPVTGKGVYTQAWVTSPTLTDAPGVALVAAGHRGQIEQENPTVLKIPGYHCEHN